MVINVFQIRRGFPRVLTRLIRFTTIMTRHLPRVIITRSRPLTSRILRVRIVQRYARRIKPRALALRRQRFSRLTTNSIISTRSRFFMVILLFQRTRRRPRVLVTAINIQRFSFRFRLFLLVRRHFRRPHTSNNKIAQATISRRIPNLFTKVSIRRLRHSLISLNSTRFLRRLTTLFKSIRPNLRLFTTIRLNLFGRTFRPQRIRRTRHSTNAFRGILVPTTPFVRLTLTPARTRRHGGQRRKRHRTRRTFASRHQRRLFRRLLAIRRTTRLPITTTRQRNRRTINRVVLTRFNELTTQRNNKRNLITTSSLLVRTIFRRPRQTSPKFTLLNRQQRGHQHRTRHPVATATTTNLVRRRVRRQAIVNITRMVHLHTTTARRFTRMVNITTINNTITRSFPKKTRRHRTTRFQRQLLRPTRGNLLFISNLQLLSSQRRVRNSLHIRHRIRTSLHNRINNMISNMLTLIFLNFTRLVRRLPRRRHRRR